jgi:hypothetical protein
MHKCSGTEYTSQLYHQYRLYQPFYVYLYLHTHIPTLVYEYVWLVYSDKAMKTEVGLFSLPVNRGL